jgi:hypothetical protein
MTLVYLHGRKKMDHKDDEAIAWLEKHKCDQLLEMAVDKVPMD